MKSYWTASIFDGAGELELRCPKCGCAALAYDPVADVAWDDCLKLSDYLGRKTTCFECGHEFTITENCWGPVDDCG